MARIRSIKPEFWQDEKLVVLPDVVRLIFLGLISLADDCGRLLDKPVKIEADLFDGETDRRDTVTASLQLLHSVGVIRRGRTASGQRIIEIRNWKRHQKVDHPNVAAAFPDIVEEAQPEPMPVAFANGSRTARESFAHHINDQRPVPTTDDRRAVRANVDVSADRSGVFAVETTPGSEPDRANAPLPRLMAPNGPAVVSMPDRGTAPPTPQPAGTVGPAFATQKAELLAACDDVQALALETLVRGHPYPDTLIGELYAIASGLHPVTGKVSGRRADVTDVIRAVSEMAANGERFAVKLFRGYVRKNVDRPAEPASADERNAAKQAAEIAQRAKVVGIIEPPRTPEERAQAAVRARNAVESFRRLAQQHDTIAEEQVAKHQRNRTPSSDPAPLAGLVSQVVAQATG